MESASAFNGRKDMRPLNIVKGIDSKKCNQYGRRQLSDCASLDSCESVPENVGWEMSLRIPKKRSHRAGHLQSLYSERLYSYDGSYHSTFQDTMVDGDGADVYSLPLDSSAFAQQARSPLSAYGPRPRTLLAEHVQSSDGVVSGLGRLGPVDQNNIEWAHLPQLSSLSQTAAVLHGASYGEGDTNTVGRRAEHRTVRPHIQFTPEVGFVDGGHNTVWSAVEVTALPYDTDDPRASLASIDVGDLPAQLPLNTGMVRTFDCCNLPPRTKYVSWLPDCF
jgi:hypothetical protein